MENKSVQTPYSAFRAEQIFEACERLLEQMSFEDLTVKDICREMGISRPTFYRYFSDKFEIAQWRWDRAGEEYLRECGRSLGWYESNYLMLKTFADHAAFFSKALCVGETQDVNAGINHGYRRRVEFLEETVRNLNPMVLTEDVKFQIAFFTDAESRSIVQWAKNGMHLSAEQLARRLESCVPRELHDLIERARQEYPIP